MIERDVVLVGKDADGNTTVDMPITRLGNLEDTAETKTAPVSGDALALVDSEAQGEMKKIAWSDVMRAVKDAVGGDDGAALEALKRALNEHEADGAAHVTTSEKATWNAKAEGEHNHDGRYYTESEVDTLLTKKETSGAAAAVQTKLNTHTADSVAHVTAEEREKWNSAGGVRIAYGSYTGTGTSGEQNPTTLAFEFVPRLVFISTSASSCPSSMLWAEGDTYAWFGNTLTAVSNYVKRDGKTLGWFVSDGVISGNTMSGGGAKYGAGYQANTSGVTYQYLAIG